MEATLLGELLNKYLSGTINDREKDQLLRLIDNPDNLGVLESLMRESFIDQTFNETENPEIQTAIQQWLQQKINEKQNKPVILWLRRTAVAASIIGVLGFGVWLVNSKNNGDAIPEITKKYTASDFSPGKKGAILTLANGQQIILDSAANGQLANEAGVTINKKDGEVLYKGSGEAGYNTMTTPRGRQYTLVLADRSKVMLNAGSSIRFPTSFPGNERVVEITGEAYFEITKDATKKFIVITAGGVRTEVLGTHFMINSYGDEDNITTTLLEGSIKVSHNKKVAVLKPGNQVRVNNQGRFELLRNANIEEATSWVDGYFYFEKADVQTVMRQLARWYDIDVEYREHVTNEFFGGKIQRDLHLAAVMDILKTIGVKYELEGKKLIIGSSTQEKG
ncbi:MAG TPA: FecR domain-containing protein [Agriterribacter sp.]|nr:FecR domain-containing protein [Agriterribacter sp.]